MAVVLSEAGEVLDAVCAAHYGREDAVEQVLIANPGLAALGPVLPARILIALPDDETPVTATLVRLWGQA